MAQKKVIFALTQFLNLPRLLSFILFLLPLIAHSEDVTFGPLDFKIPTGWRCQTEGQSMICLDESATSQKNVALVITYKNKTGEDALPVYRDQLARPRVLQQGDLSTPSAPKGVRELNINGQDWVEGVHLGSEMSNYFTHYYATTGYDKAVLVSLSIEETAHETLMRLMEPTLQSFQLKNLNTDDGDSKSFDINQSNTHLADGRAQSNSQQALASAKTISILGFNIHRNYVFLAIGLVVVLGMMAYAIFMD